MLCAPTARLDVTKFAIVPETVPVPSVVAPSLKVTVPVGETPPEMLAVSVMVAPKAGFVEEDKTAVVVTAWPTVTVAAVEVLPALSVSPP